MKPIAMTVAATAFAVVGLYGPNLAAQGMAPGYGMGPGMMMGGQARGWGPMMGAYDQGWFDALKKKLAITPAQEKAWNAYVAAARASAQSMIDTHNAVDFEAVQKMAPRDQVEFMRKMHETRLDQMISVVEARDALFKVLDEKQRKTAETALGGYGMGFGGMPCFGQNQAPAGQ